MELDTQTLMMIFFIISLVASIWKIYAFLPNKELEDDDRNEKSQEELLSIVLENIKVYGKSISVKELFEKILADEKFDKKHFWRFNQNRLQQLLNQYYLKHPNTKSIIDIYNKFKY